ncbi:hypothetical protein J1614_000045 [Plenodomus biglobosus]|nr:hypothetical protein J1614_000045 [Plenodomus biglobosus]
MPALFLVVALVVVPLIIGACLAYAGFKSYKHHCFPIHDVEQARCTQDEQQFRQEQIELRDLERPGQAHGTLQRSGTIDANVPVNLVPGAKPLEVVMIGGEGVVTYPRPSRLVEGTELQTLHNNPEIKRFESVEPVLMQCNETTQPGPSPPPLSYERITSEIISPKPWRTVINNATPQYAPPTLYDKKDTKAAELWAHTESQNLPTSQMSEVQDEDEQTEPQNTSVVESEDQEWIDEEVLEEKLVRQMSAASTLFGPHTTLLGNVSSNRGSNACAKSREDSGVDIEHDDFVNPSRAAAAGLGLTGIEKKSQRP